jgi:hypothetical protein
MFIGESFDTHISAPRVRTYSQRSQSKVRRMRTSEYTRTRHLVLNSTQLITHTKKQLLRCACADPLQGQGSSRHEHASTARSRAQRTVRQRPCTTRSAAPRTPAPAQVDRQTDRHTDRQTDAVLWASVQCDAPANAAGITSCLRACVLQLASRAHIRGSQR